MQTNTGCDMQPETVAVLCMHPNIIGLKEARGDEERWNALYPLGSAHFPYSVAMTPALFGPFKAALAA